MISAQAYRNLFHICVSIASLTTQAIRLILSFQWMLRLTINLRYKGGKKKVQYVILRTKVANNDSHWAWRKLVRELSHRKKHSTRELLLKMCWQMYSKVTKVAALPRQKIVKKVIQPRKPPSTRRNSFSICREISVSTLLLKSQPPPKMETWYP